MKNTIQAIVIPPGESARVQVIPRTLAAMQAAVGGYIEELPGSTEDWVAYGNEEGKLKGLSLNLSAHHFLVTRGHNPADPIVGPVVIVGIDEYGESCDVPQSLAEWFGLQVQP